MLSRLWIYFKEMFPPHHAIASIFMALSYYMAISLITNKPIPWDRFEIYTSAFCVMLLALMIRIMDEFKDYEDDLKNFPNRPLPSGRVHKSDLKILQTFIFTACIVLNLNNKLALIGISICIGYSILMYKWFFVEKIMRKNLPLAFLTHHPVTYLYFLYLYMALYGIAKGQDFNSIAAAIGIPIGLAMANWEVSRKIKRPQDENEYNTYSKTWGPKAAAIVAIIFQALSTTGMMWLFVKTQSTSMIFILYFAYFFYNLGPYILFISTYEMKKSLKFNAENLAIANQVTILILFVIKAYVN